MIAPAPSILARLAPAVLVGSAAAVLWAATVVSAAAPAKHLSFKRDIQPIIDANCVACHQTGSTLGGLNLEGGASYRTLLGGTDKFSKLKLVVPGRPDRSYMMHKIEGTHRRVGGSGEQMPPTGPLDDVSVRKIRAWISQGAKND